MLRIPHCLDNRFTVGGEFVSLIQSPRSAIHKYFFFVSDTTFNYMLSKPLAIVRSEREGALIILNYHIGYRINNLLACDTFL
jgi:uncharacterized protein (DUF1919 family)